MKKGIVLEKQDNYLVVMAADGAFYKTRKKAKANPNIGEEIKFNPMPHFSLSWIHSLFQFRYVGTAIAVILLAFIPFFMISPSNNVYAYVNIDINPSIELAVNRDLEVIEVHSLNDDGKKIVDTLTDWKDMTVEEVTMLIIQQTEKAGYAVDDLGVLIGVSYLDEKEAKKEVIQKISAFVEKQDGVAQTVTAFEVPKEVREKADAAKTSMNYLYAQQLILQESTGNEEEKPDVKANNETNGHKEEIKPSNDEKTIISMEKQTNQSKNEKMKEKIIEKFIKHVEKEKLKLPPGLMKKIDEYESMIDDEKILEKIEEAKEDMFVPPGQKKKEEKEQKNEENHDQDETKKGNKHGNDDEHDDHSDQNSFLPPGLEKKLKNVDIEDLPFGLQKKLDGLQDKYDKKMDKHIDKKEKKEK